MRHASTCEADKKALELAGGWMRRKRKGFVTSHWPAPKERVWPTETLLIGSKSFAASGRRRKIAGPNVVRSAVAPLVVPPPLTVPALGGPCCFSPGEPGRFGAFLVSPEHRPDSQLLA